MNRLPIIAIGALGLMLFIAVGDSLAQATQPASGAAAPGAPGRGRGGFGRGPIVPPGPPAPVPPQVMMPRPTPQEVAQMNASLEKFIESLTGLRHLALVGRSYAEELDQEQLTPAWIANVVILAGNADVLVGTQKSRRGRQRCDISPHSIALLR